MPINITEEFIRNLMEQNATLIAQVASLSAHIESLNLTIKGLQEQVNKNSKNSSKPPSSDGLKKLPLIKIEVFAVRLAKSKEHRMVILV